MFNFEKNKFSKNIIVTGYSGGAGKSFLIIQKLLPLLKEEFLSAISHTTRKLRGNEQNGKEYIFTTVQLFKEMIANKMFLEYTDPTEEIFYGSSISQYQKARNQDKFLIYDVDYKGFVQMTSSESRLKNDVVTVLLLTPVWQRIAWMLKRGDMDDKKIIQRVEYSDRIERPFFEKNKSKFDIVIEDYTEAVNVDLFANQIANKCLKT